MGTNKPKVQIILEPECYKKYKVLCERDDRTESKLGKRIIEKYIDDYESIQEKSKLRNNLRSPRVYFFERQLTSIPHKQKVCKTD